MKQIILTIIFSLAGNFVYAQKLDDNSYFQIKNVKAEILEVGEESIPLKLDANLNSYEKVGPLAVGAIINTGAQAWNIINNGQPNVNISHYYASAMPSPLTWAEVVNWKGPKKIIYSLQFENLMGITVLDMKYMVSYYYDGNVKGKGHYIANFTIKPIEFNIKWGFKFNMDIKISNPMNIGTENDPMAYLQADLNWSFSSPLKKYNEFNTYAVKGNGEFKDITEISKELTKGIPVVEKQENVNLNWN